MSIVISKYWWVFTLRGLIAMAFGLAALLWPTLTLYEIILLFGFFTLLDGGLTIFASLLKGNDKARWPQLFEGGFGLAVCVIVLVYANMGSLFWPQVAAITLVYHIAAWAILTGLFKTITTIRLRKEIEGKWALGLCGAVSILAGAILIFRAGAGVLATAWFIGIFAIVLGIFFMFIGLKLRRLRSDLNQ
ncbi:MAG: HdeD family acid-resistance protein [Deltaproteobacteria bacterium]|nr:HdeD family acid-resistance protein [Deltaproteobacteria bacterium]